ncbi:MAG: hypothetical protein PHO56_04520 [Patescibacteria group bacterium]|nr:hypothetical protein [Patescibacteria group bacterium]
MKFVLAMLAALVAFATVSAGLDFSDSKVWKKTEVSEDRPFLVAKHNGNVYIGDIDVTIYETVIVSTLLRGAYANYFAYDLDFGKAGDIWVATDSGLIRFGSLDTSVYSVKDGLPSNYIKTVYADTVNNRIIVGTDKGVGVSALDANGKPTTWTNALSVTIHQIVVVKGEIWAINNKKVYRFTAGNWVEYSQFWNPVSGDVDRDGNFWLSFGRQVFDTLMVGDSMLIGLKDLHDNGLAKFDGTVWTEHLVTRSQPGDGAFGNIRIDKNNVLWFSASQGGLGKVDLSTMTEDRVLAGTYSWAPGDQTALSITDEGKVIFAGHYAWVENIAPTAVRNPLIAKSIPLGDYKVVGIFDLKGRKIANANSFSAHSLPSGTYLTVSRSVSGSTKAEKFIVR